jgi:hypothetical protein
MKRMNPEIAGSKVSVIYNGIDFNKIDYGGSAMEERSCAVLFWGRLYYLKGVMQLLRAI